MTRISRETLMRWQKCHTLHLLLNGAGSHSDLLWLQVDVGFASACHFPSWRCLFSLLQKDCTGPLHFRRLDSESLGKETSDLRSAHAMAIYLDFILWRPRTQPISQIVQISDIPMVGPRIFESSREFLFFNNSPGWFFDESIKWLTLWLCQTVFYWTWPSRNSGFSHWKWWFSIVFC